MQDKKHREMIVINYQTIVVLNNLDNDIRTDLRLTWFVRFYAPWSPPCEHFVRVYVDLPIRFGDLKVFKSVK
jgi:hypothetical protein